MRSPNTSNLGRLRLLWGVALIAITGCSDGAGPALGSVTVTMQRSNTLTLAPARVSLVSTDAMANVAADQVAELVITISQVQFRPATADTGDGEQDLAWVSADVEELTLDLMALPTDAENPYVIAVGELATGSYTAVRLVVESASIEFASTQTVGNASFEAGLDHEVKVPSGVLKTDLVLEIMAGEGEGDENTAGLLFGPDASFQNLTATGNGQVIVSPVLKAKIATE